MPCQRRASRYLSAAAFTASFVLAVTTVPAGATFTTAADTGTTVDVALAAPTLAVSPGYNRWTATWSASPGADGYRVYARFAGTTSWTLYDTVGAGTTSYVATTQWAAQGYEVKVRAYNAYASSDSAAKAVTPSSLYEHTILADSPQVYYRLGLDDPGQVAHDDSGHGFDARYRADGVATALDHAPGALDHDRDTSVELQQSYSAGDFQNITRGLGDGAGHVIVNTDQATVELWAYLPSTSRHGGLVRAGESNCIGPIYAYRCNGWVLGVGGRNTAGNPDLTDNGNDELGVLMTADRYADGGAIGTGWHYLVMRITAGGLLCMTVDLVNQGCVDIGSSDDPLQGNGALELGGYTFTAYDGSLKYRYVEGRIDEVAVYDRYLTAATLARHFAVGDHCSGC